MKCAWKELLAILPPWCRSDVDGLGQDTLQELRLRLGVPPELIRRNGPVKLKRCVSSDDMNYIINTASRYSPWSAATAAQGYITAPGGHRIGLCGQAVVQGNEMSAMRQITSLCIRVARDLSGIAGKLYCRSGSVLIIGSPGSGKTTLLRDLIRQRSEMGPGSIGVVDERGELFPTAAGFEKGCRTDVLTGCFKEQGIEILLRTMGPSTIAVDEITSERDSVAILRAGGCGVSLLATAHAASKSDLHTRPVYKPLIASRIFDTLVILQPDKTWTAERIEI